MGEGGGRWGKVGEGGRRWANVGLVDTADMLANHVWCLYQCIT